jgi:predicted aldo/keto reductase-like oxidoreductase
MPGSTSSRRSFLATGLSAPAAAASVTVPPSPVTYCTLGRTGLKVSRLGFGCELVSDPAVVARALDLGVNFFDTARAYFSGQNERVIGKALGARRKDVVLCSRSYAKSARELRNDLEASLRELGTDYVDIWYIGWRDKPEDLTADMLEVQAAARKQGKIRFNGVSSHRPEVMLPHLLAHNHFDVALVPFNFSFYSAAAGPSKEFSNTGPKIDAALAGLASSRLGIVAMKVMAGGYRQHKPGTPLRRILEQPSAHQAALKWALRDPRIHVALPTMGNLEQVEENFRALSEPFTPRDQQLLATHLAQVAPRLCRMCGHCDGACPRGLPIADAVRFLTYAEGYGHFPLADHHWQQLPAPVRQIRCADCAACAVTCPNGVRIRQNLIRAQSLFA